MKIDFIVHPEQSDYNPGDIYRQYEASIEEVIRSSDCPVLIMDGNEKKFNLLVPESNRFSSIGVDQDSSFPRYTGHVPREEMPRLIELVGDFKTHKAVIHGAYFGRCVEHFALQLFFWFYDGVEMHVHEVGMAGKEDMVNAHEVSGAFGRSNIRWGRVHTSFFGPGISPPSAGRRFGNMTYQMMGRDTVIYSSKEVIVPPQASAGPE